MENSKSKRTRNDFEQVDDACYGTTSKKPRIRWTTDLDKFLQAIAVIIERKNPYKRFGNSNGFGEAQVVPKEILEEMRKMGVEGLNRHHVSSHLQKHRSTGIKIMDYPMQQPLPMSFHQQQSVWTAPMNLQFSRPPYDYCFGSQNQPVMLFPGPHSVNQLGFSAWTYHPEFPYSTASPPSLSSIDYQTPEAASNIINPEVNFPLQQQACVRPDTATAATNDGSSIGNSEAPAATRCDQDTGLLGLDGLDLSWLEGEGNDLN